MDNVKNLPLILDLLCWWSDCGGSSPFLPLPRGELDEWQSCDFCLEMYMVNPTVVTVASASATISKPESTLMPGVFSEISPTTPIQKHSQKIYVYVYSIPIIADISGMQYIVLLNHVENA